MVAQFLIAVVIAVHDDERSDQIEHMRMPVTTDSDWVLIITNGGYLYGFTTESKFSDGSSEVPRGNRPATSRGGPSDRD